LSGRVCAILLVSRLP